MDATASGLDGVVVAATVLSEVDGERGRLVLRGHDVEALAASATFEDAAWLLWTGAREAPASLRAELGAARVRAFERVGDAAVRAALARADGMDALRASLAQLDATGDARVDRVTLVASTAVYAAAWSRLSRGAAPIAPDASRAHGEDYLRMVTGADPTAAQTRAITAYLVTVTDHGMNASTFTARVVASTGSDVVSSVVAAVGALKGPLHGGAPGPVLDMLDAIAQPARAEAWLEGELAAGRRIMGMGHRVYRTRDPRAAVLERAIEALERDGGASGTARLGLARAVERAADGVLAQRHPDRPLRANVEFYTAVVLDAVGIPRTAFSPTFAVGRVVGWTAHFEEQRAVGRLIRPASTYAGPAPAGAL